MCGFLGAAPWFSIRETMHEGAVDGKCSGIGWLLKDNRQIMARRRPMRIPDRSRSRLWRT